MVPISQFVPQGINPDAKKQDLGINLYVPNNGTRDQSLTGIGGPRVYVVQLCANIDTQIKITSCCTSRVPFIAKTDMSSPVYCTSVRNTSLLYKCTQNQFTVKVNTKPVYCKSVQKQFTVQEYT